MPYNADGKDRLGYNKDGDDRMAKVYRLTEYYGKMEPSRKIMVMKL